MMQQAVFLEDEVLDPEKLPKGGFEVPTKGLGEELTKGLGETLRIALHLRAALWVFSCCDFIVHKKKKKSHCSRGVNF